jgi:hypothetical protein
LGNTIHSGQRTHGWRTQEFTSLDKGDRRAMSRGPSLARKGDVYAPSKRVRRID